MLWLSPLGTYCCIIYSQDLFFGNSSISKVFTFKGALSWKNKLMPQIRTFYHFWIGNYRQKLFCEIQYIIWSLYILLVDFLLFFLVFIVHDRSIVFRHSRCFLNSQTNRKQPNSPPKINNLDFTALYFLGKSNFVNPIYNL
jgi:hypothetical protein